MWDARYPFASTRQQARNGTVLQVDPWSKAAECDHAIERVADPERRIVLESLRQYWIALGNELPRAPARLQTQLATVATIHAQLMAGYRHAMH